MQIEHYGSAPNPVVTWIGVFEPITEETTKLFYQLHKHAKSIDKSSMIVVLDPHPYCVASGKATSPIFNDLQTRIQFIRATGIEIIAWVKLESYDECHMSPADFLDRIQQIAPIHELWVGKNQRLGDDKRHGDQLGILIYTKRNSIQLTRLPDTGKGTSDRDTIVNYLSDGRVKPATEFLGRPPVFKKPEVSHQLNWKCGSYSACALDHPNDPVTQNTIQVELSTKTEDVTILQWPDNKVEYLAFIDGPGDRTEDRQRTSSVSIL